MTSQVSTITVDSVDPYVIAQFWAEALGYIPDPDEPNEPGKDDAWLQNPGSDRYAMLFQRVPETKVVKNRLHLDISPVDRTRDEEVERLMGLGATLYDDQRRPDGTGWVVLTDPEGNEFCVERSDAERG